MDTSHLSKETLRLLESVDNNWDCIPTDELLNTALFTKDPKTLQYLCDRNDWELDRGLSSNTSTPPKKLRAIFLRSNTPYIREQLACNPNTPASVLQALSQHTNLWKDLVSHPNIDTQSLTRMLEHCDKGSTLELQLKKRLGIKPEPETTKPNYYNLPGTDLDCLDIITRLELDFLLGNTLKYLWRAGKKDSNALRQDIEKAREYLDRWLAAH